MNKLFLLTLTILIITILTQQNNQAGNNNNNNQANQTNSNAPKNNTKKAEDKEFNLTDSLLKFFDEMFGDSKNKTNKTDPEAKKKYERRNKKRRNDQKTKYGKNQNGN